MHPFSKEHTVRACTSHCKSQLSMPTFEVYDDYYGMGLRSSGESLIFTLDQIYHVQPGDIVLINKDLYHRSKYISEHDVRSKRVQFNELAAQSVINCIGIEDFNKLFDHVVIHLNRTYKDKVNHILSELIQEYATHDRYSMHILESLLCRLIVTLLRSIDENATLHTSENFNRINSIIVAALRYIENHSSKDPSLEDVANAISISPSYLSRLFTKELGISYSEFLVRHKIQNAQRLLVKTHLSITEIAISSGFGSSNYFCYVFKKYMNITPYQYRKEKTRKE
ncbi:MAG: AraC family transcriptional regulator [Cellulosilyticum sp.]|nr:AraC family transcriptional regulator [Cellulosilyticum sp.]